MGSRDTGNREDETRLAGEVIEKQMRTGPTSLSPVLDDWIRMRLQNLANQQKASAAESGS